jgi:hypothetical protein
MAEWKRRTNWAWPDWTYFFGSMVIVPLMDIGLGNPLEFLNDKGSSRYGRASWVLEFAIVLIALNRLDPIGRLLKIPGDDISKNADGTSKTPMSRRAQAVVCLWIGVLLGVLGVGGGVWVHSIATAPGSDFNINNHEGVFFMLFIALLFALVCLLTGGILWLQSRNERVSQARLPVR